MRRIRATAIGAAAVVAAGAALAAAALSDSKAETSRQLAFVRGEANGSEIYVVDEDGTHLRRVTRNRASDFSPSWSPDGKQLLFVSNRDGDDELFVADATGRNVRQLTHNRAQDLTPQWSRDGRWIAFASDRARRGEPEIWVMPSNGGNGRRLVETVNHPTWQDAQYSPSWSPDGRRLVFSMAAAASNPELHVVGANGKGLKRLTRTRGSSEVYGDDTMPDWSADGTIFFVSNREQRSSDVWSMAADGSAQRPVVRRARADDWNPRVSPDGSLLAFTEHVLPAGPAYVAVMNRDGSGLRRVTRGAEPAWRPVG